MQSLRKMPFAAFALAALVSACVRLSDPGEFKCEADSDCASDEKCLALGEVGLSDAELGECFPDEYCVSHAHCRGEKFCDKEQHECVVPECRADSDCGAYSCDKRRFRCEDACSDSCNAGFTCVDSACLPNSQTELKPNGTSCDTGADCESGYCCADSSGSGLQRCAPSCVDDPEGDECSSDAECGSLSCCPRPDRLLGICAENCVLGGAGAECLTDEFCESQECISHECTAALLGEGEACEDDLECASDVCCFNGDHKVCSAACEPTIGDPCSEENACAVGSCRVQHIITSPVGYCSESCEGACPQSSNGRENVCATVSEFSVTCQPACETHEDCQRIHPELRCLDYYDSAETYVNSGCDFER